MSNVSNNQNVVKVEFTIYCEDSFESVLQKDLFRDISVNELKPKDSFDPTHTVEGKEEIVLEFIEEIIDCDSEEAKNYLNDWRV